MGDKSGFCDAARHAQSTGHAHSLSHLVIAQKKVVRTCALDQYLCWKESGSLEAIRPARVIVCLSFRQTFRICAWDRCRAGMSVGCTEAMERGVFRCDVCLSFVSMVVFAEGKGGDMRGRGNTHGREWTSVAIDGRIEGWEEGFDAVSFILLFLPLVSSVERASWAL